MSDEGKICYCPLKNDRLVDEFGGQQPYEPVGLLSWSTEVVQAGKVVKVKGMSKDCKLKRWSVLVSIHRTDYLVTNEVEPCDTATAEQESSVRWMIEPFHRELQQLTGVQACQCRLARS